MCNPDDKHREPGENIQVVKELNIYFTDISGRFKATSH